jgi:molecular chaperone GrpE (heat shock protein)
MTEAIENSRACERRRGTRGGDLKCCGRSFTTTEPQASRGGLKSEMQSMSKSDELREQVESLQAISKRLREDADRLEAEAEKLKKAIEEEKPRKKPRTDV